MFSRKIEKKNGNSLPGALYTVPTSSLKLPIIVPDRSKFREYKTWSTRDTV